MKKIIFTNFFIVLLFLMGAITYSQTKGNKLIMLLFDESQSSLKDKQRYITEAVDSLSSTLTDNRLMLRKFSKITIGDDSPERYSNEEIKKVINNISNISRFSVLYDSLYLAEKDTRRISDRMELEPLIVLFSTGVDNWSTTEYKKLKSSVEQYNVPIVLFLLDDIQESPTKEWLLNIITSNNGTVTPFQKDIADLSATIQNDLFKSFPLIAPAKEGLFQDNKSVGGKETTNDDRSGVPFFTLSFVVLVLGILAGGLFYFFKFRRERKFKDFDLGDTFTRSQGFDSYSDNIQQDFEPERDTEYSFENNRTFDYQQGNTNSSKVSPGPEYSQDPTRRHFNRISQSIDNRISDISISKNEIKQKRRVNAQNTSVFEEEGRLFGQSFDPDSENTDILNFSENQDGSLGLVSNFLPASSISLFDQSKFLLENEVLQRKKALEKAFKNILAGRFPMQENIILLTMIRLGNIDPRRFVNSVGYTRTLGFLSKISLKFDTLNNVQKRIVTDAMSMLLNASGLKCPSTPGEAAWNAFCEIHISNYSGIFNAIQSNINSLVLLALDSYMKHKSSFQLVNSASTEKHTEDTSSYAYNHLIFFSKKKYFQNQKYTLLSNDNDKKYQAIISDIQFFSANSLYRYNLVLKL